MAKRKRRVKEVETILKPRPLEIEVEQLTTRLLLTESVLEDTRNTLKNAQYRLKIYSALVHYGISAILLGFLFYYFCV